MTHPSTRWAPALAIMLGVFNGHAAAAVVLPDFASATFLPNAPIDNRYFPLLDNRTLVYTGRDASGTPVDEGFEFELVGAGPSILGVATVSRRDRAFEAGVLQEDTFDYYAQDTQGNVWYMGEDVTNYVYGTDGTLLGTNTSSSWRAGVNDALPGYAMRAQPMVGDNFYQEFAVIDAAVDEGETTGVGLTLTVNGVTYNDVVQIYETFALNPDAREFKYYAGGIGLILAAESLDANRSNPVLNVGLVPVPEPSSALLMLIGLPLAAWVCRRKRA